MPAEEEVPATEKAKPADKVRAASKKSASEPVAADKPKRKTGKIVLIVALVVVVAALAAATYMFLLKTGPEQVVRQYLVAENSRNWPVIKSLLNKDSLALLPSDDKLPKADKTQPPPPATEIGKAKVDKDKATVPVTIKEQGGAMGAAPQELDVVLVKENGVWKVDLKATVMGMWQKAMAGAAQGGAMGGAPGGGAPAEGGPAGGGAPGGGMQSAPPAETPNTPAPPASAPAPAPKKGP
jgi:uncharacterized membrane protein YgcG